MMKNALRSVCALTLLVMFQFGVDALAVGNGGQIAIYTHGTLGDNVVDASAAVYDLPWDATVRQDEGYTLGGGTINVTADAGHYLVLHNARYDASSGNRRRELQQYIVSGGLTNAVGWGQGFIRMGSGQNECVISGGGILELPSSDNISIRVHRTDSQGADDVDRIANASGLKLIKLDSNWDYCRLSRNTDQTGPTTTTFVPVQYNAQDELDGGTFAHTSGSADITLKDAGHYLVFANTYLFESIERSVLIQRLTVGSSVVTGATTTAYIRGNQDSCSEGAANIGVIIETTQPNQVLNVECALGVNRSPTLYKANKTAVTIVKLPDDGDYIRLDDSGTDNFNATAPGAVLGWDTEYEIDSGGFTHTDSQITAAADDDYLFFTSLYDPTDNAQRQYFWQRWTTNGTSDPITYANAGGYGRSGGGADEVGDFSGIVLSMTSGMSIQVMSEALAAGSTLDAVTKGLQGVRIGSILLGIPVQNVGSAGVSDSAASLLGTLTAPVTNYTVYAYYSTNDNADVAAWFADAAAASVQIGSFTNVSGLSITGNVSSLTQATTYYWTMVASNATEGATVAVPNLSFTTVTAESDPPVVSSLSPTNNQTNVDLGANLVATFDENIYLVNGGVITITNLTDGTGTVITLPDAQVSAAGAVLTINPAFNLDPADTYAVQIDNASVEDIFNNVFLGINDTTTWRFSMDQPPSTYAFSPADEASGVQPDDSLVAHFDEAVTLVNGGIITVTNLTDGTVTELTVPDSQVSAATTNVTISLSSPMTVGDDYAVLIDANAVEDSAGNLFAGISSTATWNFTISSDKNWSLVAYWPLTNGVHGQTVTTAPLEVDDPDHPTTDGVEGGSAVSKWYYDNTHPTGGRVVFQTFDDTRLVAGTMGIVAGEDVTWATWMRSVSNNTTTFMGTRDGSYMRFDPHRVSSGGWLSFDFSPDANDNVWHHMVLRRSAGTWRVFVDGVQASGSGTQNGANNSTFELGGTKRYNADFHGFMSDAAIWKEALSATRIAALAAGSPVVLDATAPTIVTLSPTNNATGVGTVDNLVVTFSETVQTNGGFNIVLTNLTDSTGLVIPTGDSQITISNAVMTINPTAPLALAKTYAVMIDDGAVSDDSFNAVSITDTTTWRFETAAGDAVPPTIASLNPLNGAIQVPLAQNLVVTFDESVSANTGNVMITNLTDGVGSVISVLDAQITVAGLTMTINPSSDLLFGKTYAVLVDAGAVQDSSSNPFAGISSTSTWQFGSDTAPAITTLSPLNNAAAVIPDTDLVATFDENIFVGTGNVVISNLTDGTGIVLPIGDSQITVAGGTMTIDTVTPLEDRKIYAVLIDATAIEDNNTTTFAGISDTVTWRFTTTNDANWSLVAYWPFDDGPIGAISGGTVLDDVIDSPEGDEIGGTVNNGTGSFVYDATRDRTVWRTPDGNRADAGDSQMNRDFTWAVWGKSDSNDGGPMMGTRSGDYTRFTPTSLSGSYISFTYATAFNDDKWHHFVFRRVGNTFTAWVDGTNQATKVQVEGDNNMRLELGGTSRYGEDFNGYLSDSAIWKEALPTDRITQLYEGGLVLADTTAPVITTLDPTNNATGVAVGANLVVTFDEDIQLNTGEIVITNLVDGASVAISVDGVDPDGVVSVAGAVVTINPTANFNPNETYAVRIEADAIQNIYEYGFAGISDTTTWRFTTTAPDAIPPVIDTLNPLDGATGVTISQDLVLTFDENVVLVNGGVITLTNLTDGSTLEMTVPDGQLSTSSADLTINPASDLNFATSYAILISTGAVEDTSGNAFAGILNNTTWDFTTDSAPVITALSPLDDASGVNTRADLVMSFNRDVAIIPGGTITITNLTSGAVHAITLADSQVDVSGSTVTIDARINLVPGNQYAVLVTGNAIEDLFGQNFAGIGDSTTWNFTAETDRNANIVAYWPMSDGPIGAISASTIVDDRIDDPDYAETDGTVEGGTGAYVYDTGLQRIVWQTGDDDRLNAGNSQMYDNFTWVCWAKSSGGDAGPLMGTRSGTYLRFNLTRIDGSYMGTIEYTDVNDNTWHHMAFVREGTQVRVYIDGVQSGTSTETATSNNMKFEIGGSSRYGEDFTGCMYDVAVWKEALSVARIQGMAAGDPPWIPPTTVMQFR